MKNDMVTKSNALIDAEHYLTLEEERIILYILSKIRPEDKDFKTYKVRVVDFCNFMDIAIDNSFEFIKNFYVTLSSRNICFESIEENSTKKTFVYITWLSRMNYKDGNGYIDLELNPGLKPHLLNLSDNFTTYKLSNITNLKSIYSIRFYELLKQYEKSGNRTISINDLREKLKFGKTKYKDYANLKAEVIDVAMKELEANTDIYFTFEEIKKGEQVVSIKFYIKENTSQIEQAKTTNIE